MKRYHTFLLLICLLNISFLPSCHKRSAKPETLDFSNFTGITTTEENGTIIERDGDWCFVGESSTSFGPAYPNPATDHCSISSILRALTNIRIEVYNTDEVLVRTLFLGIPGGHEVEAVWDLKDSEGERVPQGLYRVFLVIDQFQCHGDIQVNEL
ncbi:MAG: hypothetical protein GY855_17690 [candidate division Zixibacteria bacterium]|nr:hypothetical protein [candidate division Zixibacteria bacterium]